jgi:hypothetical protein
LTDVPRLGIVAAMSTPIAKIALEEMEYSFDAEDTSPIDSTVCARHPDIVIGPGDCLTCENEAGEFAEAEGDRNFTAQDARDRIIQARMGSLSNPTERYLETLEAELMIWIEAVRAERFRQNLQVRQGDI